MNATKVNSSMVVAFFYDKEYEFLNVEFNNGARYTYFDVPKTLYDGLISAGSIGKFFAKNVRLSFDYVRVH